MNIPTPALFAQMIEYLALVDKGDLTEARTKAHDAMMTAMRAEKFEFETRDEARELAMEIVTAVNRLLEVKPRWRA